jgi:long-chain acyl-CoA synthetase
MCKKELGMMKETMVAYIKNALQKHWDRKALSDYKGGTYTYGDVAEKILWIHHLYHKIGIKKGDKIVVLGKNSAHWAITYLATITYGAVIVPILPDFKPADVHHIINHSDATGLFADDSLYESLDPTAIPAVEFTISLNNFALLESTRKGNEQIYEKSILGFISHINEKLQPKHIDFKEIPNSELAAMVYTSGTTGFSKGVMLPHNSLIANVVFAMEHMPLKPGDTIVSFLPIAHVFGCAFEFLFPFCTGCHITFLKKIPSPRIIVKAFQEIKPHLILSVPLVIEKIYRKQIKPKIEKPVVKALLALPLLQLVIRKKLNKALTEVFGGNFTEIVVGGAAFNAEVEDFLRMIKFRYTVGYGMTECGPLISYTNWRDYKARSCGMIVDQLELRIDSSDEYKEVGEILVRGENVMTGYYKNPEATQQAIDADGWLHTGDLGVKHEDNTIFIRGRSKSMIQGASGKNIYPEEIEAKLNNLAYVQESIVIDRNEKLVALVYPDLEAVDQDKISEKELTRIMESNRRELNSILPGYMSVSAIEIYPEEFEKTPKKSIKRFLYQYHS